MGVVDDVYCIIEAGEWVDGLYGLEAAEHIFDDWCSIVSSIWNLL